MPVALVWYPMELYTGPQHQDVVSADGAVVCLQIIVSHLDNPAKTFCPIEVKLMGTLMDFT